MHFHTQSKAAVLKETDHPPPAKRAKPAVSSSDRQATCVPLEPDGTKKKGSRKPAIAKGKTRQLPANSVALVDPIIPVSCSSLSDGVPDTCILPQVSYPEELGYAGDTLEPSKSVCPKPVARKKPSAQIIEKAQTSTRKKVQPNRISPVRRSPRVCVTDIQCTLQQGLVALLPMKYILILSMNHYHFTMCVV